MIVISAHNGNEAWRKTLVAVLRQGTETDNEFYYRDEPVVVKLAMPTLEAPDPHFPMSPKHLEIINRYITTGENEESVPHEWTKLYHHRLFDGPHAQVPYIIEKLRRGRILGETLACLWDKSVDQVEEISPCTVSIWCRIKKDSLETHIHAHSSDAYKKLLMNIQEFIAVHHYIADQVSIRPGAYYHFIDSCHVHQEDQERALDLIGIF